MKLKIRKKLMSCAVVMIALLGATEALSASVYNCSTNGKRCTARLEIGSIGDRVTVLNDKARKIAVGRIIKKKGAFGVISLTETQDTVKKGYPIIVNNETNNSNLEWAATFSYQGD